MLTRIIANLSIFTPMLQNVNLERQSYRKVVQLPILAKNWIKYSSIIMTTEKELLLIILCLKQYQQILYGGVINIYTGHQNLTFQTLSVQQFLCWQLFFNEFDLNLKYIEGNKNVLADCFSRLPQME